MASENAQPTMARMSPGLVEARYAAHTATTNKQDAGNDQTACRRRVRIDHLVVDVVRQRVGDGQQQAVGGRERGGKTAGGDQARDHIRKARDLRCGEHDHVRIDREVLQPQHARMARDRLTGVDDRLRACRVLAADLDQPKLAPGEHPRPDVGEVPADDVGVHLELRERRIGRRREVEQEDEEQRPCHRLTRLTHRRGGEVAHQDVRQRRRADHHAEDDAEEVQRAVGEERLDTCGLSVAAVVRPAASIWPSRTVMSAIA